MREKQVNSSLSQLENESGRALQIGEDALQDRGLGRLPAAALCLFAGLQRTLGGSVCCPQASFILGFSAIDLLDCL